MHLFFELLEVLFFRLVLFLLNFRLGAVSGSGAFWQGLRSKASCGVRLHGSAEALGGTWYWSGTGANALVG